MKWKLGYKVVNNGHTSIMAEEPLTPKNLTRIVKYKRYNLTQPNTYCGPLAVFTNTRDAQFFKEIEQRYSDPPAKYHTHACRYIPSTTKELHANSRLHHRKRTNAFPLGTDFADIVKTSHHI